MSYTRTNFPTPTMLGVQYTKEDNVYEKIQTINGYTFTIPPINQYHNRSAEQKFVSFAGAVNPMFNPDKFDALRERVQVGDKKETHAIFQAIAVLYTEHLCKAFMREKNLDYAEIERMFYPHYLPTYEAGLRAVGLRKPLWWRPGIFASLENLSRLALDDCKKGKEAQLSFEDWYSLFWNYYTPFTPLGYLLLVTAQPILWTRELVDGVADYLAWRHSLLDDQAKKNPILFLGSRTGKIGALLSQTKKIPVPIIHTHENPNNNPYLLYIPPAKQADFTPPLILKMKNQEALQKYEPSIVLMSEMGKGDDTVFIRAQGSVREYMYFGMQNSYVEGHPWETWGNLKYKPKDGELLPPFLREGWHRLDIHYLSRWIIHKNDSELQMGNGAVTTWTRAPVMPSKRIRLGWKAKRLSPFF